MSFLDEALSSIREVIVSKPFDFLLGKLGSYISQFATEKQIHEGMHKLKMELLEIRAVLDDAEERQLKDQSVKIWLSNLQNLAYDLDDILDEIATEISRRNLMMQRRGGSSKKPRLMISDSYNTVMFNRDMMSKINDVTARLKDLEPQKNQLQLRMISCHRSERIEERLQPTSVEIESHVYGRDEDRETILELLSNNDDEGSFVIPIIGMGGIGKTTLAQLVYNDASIQNHFDLKAWVCVSDDFDVTRITKAILQSVSSEPCNDNELTSLQEKLKKKLSEKKFLIVLDDVWNEIYHNWTILQSPFLTRTPGSKIIVTTRNLVVSATMGASHAHFLKVLSDNDCLSVFAQHAIGAKDFGGHPNLEEVAGKIVRKCNGLPLAAKTLGGLLRTNVDHDAWKDILESEIWKLSEHQCGIIPALQLSYHHLPPHLKKCFAYCSIFPKDYEFAEEEVILLWRAEGLLQEAQDKQRIELGHKYFRDLLSRSLLQISSKDNFRFIMHDLINDLAQSVAGELCFRIEGDKQISKQARHLSYIASECDGIKKFEGIWKAKHLRTFLPLRLSYNRRYYVTNYVLAYLLQDLRCLRVLSLEGYEISVLPDFIGDLKHLRFLDFSRTCIKSLPESISTLYNLETLLLFSCCYLEKLPSKMENLVNLCYLDITYAPISEGMPSNFGTLTNLQRLSHFVVSKGKGYQIRELKDLSNLKGRLCISGLENVTQIQDAWKAKLSDKAGLEELELEWSTHFDNRIKEVEKKVLDFLQPSKGLKELAVKGYCGATLAKWVGDSSFDNLQSLWLVDCPNCMSLPSIGKLPSLKEVRINGLHSVTNVGVEFFGEDTPNAFPSLEILKFQDMLEWKNWNLGEDDDEAKKFPKLRELCICNCPKLMGTIPEILPSLEILQFQGMLEWKNWNLGEDDDEAKKFPKLRELCIRNCPKLMGTIPEFLPSLEKLVIEGCEKLEISISSLPKLLELKIYKCKEVVYKGFANHSSLQKVILSDIRKFTCRRERLRLASVRVESLVIYNCEELFSLQENNWGFLTQSMSLGNLEIGGCAQLFSIGAEGEREELMQLKVPCSIEHMAIRNCERLEKLSTTLQSITSLRVSILPKTDFSFKEQFAFESTYAGD